MSYRFARLALMPFVLLATPACGDRDTSVYEDRQPRIEQTAYQVETVAKDFDYPWSLAFLPNGDMLVTEKPGRLWRVSDGQKSEIKGVPEVYYGGQGGLLEIAVAPDFSSSRTVYLSYSGGDDDANATHLMKAVLDGDTLTAQNVIFVAKPWKDSGNHFGGKIGFLPDQTIMLTLGDGFRYREEAQNLDNHLGKIVRVMADGSVPDDNPYIGTQGALPEIFSMGHRNVQGLAIDGGRIFAHEHGARGGDEVNLLEGGTNYGWPIVTTGVDYSYAQITPYKTLEGYEDPLYDWVPSIAPSGLAVYRGDLFPEWDGDLLIGGLASMDLRRLDYENGKFVGEWILLNDLGERIREVRTGPDGAIYVLTDSDEGRLLRIGK